ncbi:MAG: transglycosylase SLT domain-containing protein [Rhodomicrobium sp.]
MGARKRLIAIALSMFSLLPLARGQEANLCEREMTQAAAKYRVPLGILFAVGLTETGSNGNLHAYALNLKGNTVFSLNKEKAIERFNAAKAAGVKWIDVGCMQLNYYFHGERFSSVAEMLDPHRNVDYAARFLSELREREGSWTLAVARYNAGKNNDPAQKRYVCRVLERLVQSGFGAWTAKASAFCEEELRTLNGPSPKRSSPGENSLAQVH